MMSLPLALKAAIESGQCVLFVGSGIGACASDPAGKPAPAARQLATELATQFAIDVSGMPDLERVAQVVEIRKGRAELLAFLTGRFANLEPDENLRWLFSVYWRAIFTTNYDRIIQRAYELNDSIKQQPITISATSDLVTTLDPLQIPIYHLHGCLFEPNARIIITEDDYAAFQERRRMLFEILKLEFTRSTFLYVGYSNEDPNWRTLLAEIRAEFHPASPPPAFRVTPSTDPLSKEILASKGIETIDTDLQTFAAHARSILTVASPGPDFLALRRDQIPPALRENFIINPAATSRLVNSWTFVNQAPFNEVPNLVPFLRGDLPNWGLVGRNIPFERDAADNLYERLLDFATTTKPRSTVLLLLAPAGYGVFTTLMVVAARIASDQDGYVFFHKRAAPLIEGDIFFAASLPSDRKFFFIDNASDFASTLESVNEYLKHNKIPACLVLGDRLNEWRQARPRLRGEEFFLDELSDSEIGRLLDYLQGHDALGQLKHLDRALQEAAVRNKHGKQLLVALRELIEDNNFDAIVEDEYRNIADETAKAAYAVVCSSYHLGTHIRDTVLSEVVGLPLVDLHQRTGAALEGVVVWDDSDSSRGIFAARARHQVISQIVLERCIHGSERDRIILETLRHLNINYYLDRRCFDTFVRSDIHVESLSTLDGKIRFFESAARKDPANPYVYQHYSRMLLRDEKTELALSQIAHALELGPRLRVLHHTRGKILERLALNAESIEIGRRRLAQSEAAFRTARNLSQRDPYPYQGLADLYLGWAKRVGSADLDGEVVDYVAKAEEVIGEGLKVARDREGLWIISAEIQKWMGDQPGAIVGLQKAVAENPGSTVARYLLARIYCRMGHADRAVDLLRPVIERDPKEFRPCLEYSLALLDLGEPYVRVIATLRLSTLYGFRDARFIAVLDSCLVMNGDLTEADRIFRQSQKRSFSYHELRRAWFKPRKQPGSPEPLSLQGSFVRVGPGYGFIRCPRYPDFYFAGSRVGRLRLSRGLTVEFQLAFSARGPEALDPHVI